METIDNKPYEIKGEAINGSGTLEVIASSIKMPDGKTLAETIIIMNNRIEKLEKEVEELKGKL